MQFLSRYNDEDSDNEHPPPPTSNSNRNRKKDKVKDKVNEQAGPTASKSQVSARGGLSINSAPPVDLHLVSHEHSLAFVNPLAQQVYHNPTAYEMWKPVNGPQNPFNPHGALPKNTLTGFVQESHVDHSVFDTHYHQFMSHGVTVDPSQPLTAPPTIAPVEKLVVTNNHISTKSAKSSAASGENAQSSTEANDSSKKSGKKKRDNRDPSEKDPSNVQGFKGPWGGRFEIQVEQPELTDEQKAYLAEQAAKKAKKGDDEEAVAMEETTVFHGEAEKDYQGRTYIHIPGDANLTRPEKCFIPKKSIHTWAGHTGGVTAIRFFPKSGHLLLSASMDHSMKIWGVNDGNRRCLRTINGHNHSVRDICFNADGTRFLSASHDKYVKLWDTETGKCISRHTTHKLPYCVKFHPEKNNECLVGQSNKKIVQWDLDGNKVAQEYDEHLGAVNTITFIDENRRFVSTSDDKKVFIWDYGIPVVIKHIAEPEMHSMPAVEVHPNNKWFAGQSMDNQILIYATSRGFKVNKRKVFRGHFVAGYAAQVSFSPDGRFIMSGDGEGRCFFWDWKSTKLFKKLKCHDKVTIGCIWHPTEPSRVATCSWDGTIKYWD